MENLKELFEIVSNTNQAYYNTWTCDNGKFIIISKYQYTNFEMKVLPSRNSNYIEKFYNSLGSFDCFNLLSEILESNKVAH